MKLARLSKLAGVLALALLCTALSNHKSLAQSQKGIPSDGRDFYFAYMPTSFNWCGYEQPYQQAYILVCGYYDSHVQVNYFDAVTGKEIAGTVYTISAKNYVQIPLN